MGTEYTYQVHLLCILFHTFFTYKRRGDLHNASLCTMDVLRCVLITADERIWKNTALYLSKRTSEYNWIVNRPKDLEKSEIEVFVWWASRVVFSATPLRSYLKRLKQRKEGCFKISKAVKAKSILKKLINSTKTHYWDDGYVGNELMECLKVRIHEVRKEVTKRQPKEVAEKMEVTEQESEPQPSTSQPPKVTAKTEVTERRSEPEITDVKEQPKRTQVSGGLILKLLLRTASNVSEFGETLSEEIAKVNGRMDKFAEQLCHKPYDPTWDGLYDPAFAGDCKM